MFVSSANAAVQSHSVRDFGNSAKRLQSLDDRVRRDPCNVQLIQNAVLAIRDAGQMLDAAGEDTGLLPASFPEATASPMRSKTSDGLWTWPCTPASRWSYPLVLLSRSKRRSI